jgi:zinc protease
MKNLFILSLITLFTVINMQANDKVDLTQKPEPLPAKDFNFPKYETAALKNGLKLFVIKDDQQPTIVFRIMISGGSAVEGKKTGVADLTAQILSKGAGTRSAFDIANALDGIGANVSVSAGGDYNIVSGSCLKKHLPLVMEITRDMLTKPTFPEEELPKLVSQMNASIKQEKSRSSAVAATISRIALYGLDHPYSRKASEESLKQITISDLKAYFANYFLPNNATMSIIGDVDVKEIKSDLEKYFADWKQGTVGSLDVPKPQPMPLGVYFVKRPVATQSSVVVATPAVPRNHPDYDLLNISSDVIGAGFAGRLFRTLREQYSYTYTPFGYLTQAKFVNRFACGADVRSNVTDSSVSVILDQLRLLTSEAPGDEELNRLKKYDVGQYLMSFASSEFVGSLIQNANFYGIDMKDIKNYHNKIKSFTPNQIQFAAEKYMNPKSAYIIVVGKPEVIPTLEKFGKVYEFNMDYQPISGENAKMEKVDLTAQQLIDKYVQAIGGKEKINSINTLTMNGTMVFEAQGQQMPGNVIEKTKIGNKTYKYLNIQNVNTQEIWSNGTNAWMKAQGTLSQAEGDDKDKIVKEAVLFGDAKLLDNGNKCEVLGKQQNNILLKVIYTSGLESTYYFDASNYLINKKESVEMMGTDPLPVTETFSDYKEYNGIKMPSVIKSECPIYNMKVTADYKFNESIEDSLFTPKQ